VITIEDAQCSTRESLVHGGVIIYRDGHYVLDLSRREAVRLRELLDDFLDQRDW